jgi:small subunit ribosomal protein S4
VYGLREFRRYFDDARRQDGPTGRNLLALIERRLDNVVHRLGLAQPADGSPARGPRHVLVDG